MSEFEFAVDCSFKEESTANSNSFKIAQKPLLRQKAIHSCKPTISVTTIQRDLREVDFSAVLPLVSTGSYYRDAVVAFEFRGFPVNASESSEGFFGSSGSSGGQL